MANGPVYNPGRYWGRAASQSFGKSSTGTPQFSITFDIQGAVDPNDPQGALMNCVPSQRTVYWYLTAKTVEFVVEDLELLGFNKPSVKFLDPSVEGFFDFTGQEVELYCKHEPYNNQLKERWSLNKPRDGFVAPPLETNEVRKLDALFGKSLKALAGKAAQTPTETPAQIVADDPTEAANAELAKAGVNEQGDDVPF